MEFSNFSTAGPITGSISQEKKNDGMKITCLKTG
jgi:hypothetical protein